MKKAIVMFLTLSLAVSAIGPVAYAEEEEFNFRACIASEPETLDPNLESSVDGAVYSQHMFEGLMKFSNTDEYAAEGDDKVMTMAYDYGAADSYEVSEDGLTWTFHIREDAKWSDGEPVTAQDFVYGWQRAVDPANAADYGYLLDDIVVNATAIQNGEADPDTLGIVALDDNTLQITLESECPYFIGICAFAAYMPIRQDIVEKYGDEWTEPGNMVTNGAYVLTDWVHDSYIEMSKNEYYWGTSGPDKITWYLNNSQSSQLAAYQAGEYDFFYDVPSDQIESLQASGDLFIADNISTYYLYLSADNIPDWRVRAAIALCIDRENIVENVTQGGQTPATGLVAAGITDSEGNQWTDVVGSPLFDGLAELYPDYDLETYSGRCELAQALLDEAVADGYDINTTIDYEYNTSEAHQAIAEAVASDCQTVLGLNVVTNNSEWQTYTNNLSLGGFGIARLGWSADYDDASTYIELFETDGSYNYSNWASDEYTALVEEARSLPAGEERDQVMEEAEKLLFSEGGFPVSPLYFYTQVYCMADGYANAGWSPLGYFNFINLTRE